MNNNITKLGVGIIAFEGLEHIKNIIYEIKDLVDIIVLCLQKTSYHGDPINEDDVNAANELKDYGYVDEIIWFEPITDRKEEGDSAPRAVETDKRNFILDYLEKTAHCSHSLVIDSDEFYDHDDFARAKEEISKDDNAVVTYCQYINYYRDYQHLLVWPFLCYVPFITQSHFRFDFKNGQFGKPSDPTRRYFIGDTTKTKFVILDYELIKMHHLSFIRLDITKKISSWSAKRLFKNVPDLENKILERYNNYKEGQNAIIMFNVPGNTVLVERLPKQYIHPRYKIYEPLLKYEGRDSNNVNSK